VVQADNWIDLFELKLNWLFVVLTKELEDVCAVSNMPCAVVLLLIEYSQKLSSWK
jgi:hypothetical protein